MGPRSVLTCSVSPSRRLSCSDHAHEHSYDNGADLWNLTCLPLSEQRDTKKQSPQRDENLSISQSVENAVGPRPESILTARSFFSALN